MTDQTPATGTVDVAGRVFVVTELPTEAEFGFGSMLRLKAREQMGPGSFFAPALPVADWLRSQDRHGEANGLLRTAAELVLSKAGASDDAGYDYRQSPDGVAFELFTRTRATHPEATEKELRAVITAVNAAHVHQQIVRAISGPKAKTPSGSPSG